MNNLIEILKNGSENLFQQEILKMLSKPENDKIEFKESKNSLPKDFWKTYSSFSNTHGGLVILGIKEINSKKYEVVGVENYQKIIDDLMNACNSIDKVSFNLVGENNIFVKSYNSKKIIVVHIPELSIKKKPLYLSGNIKNTYIRRGTTDQKASEDDIKRFIRDESDDLDQELLENYTIEDLDEESVFQFKAIIHNRNSSREYNKVDDIDFLTELGVFQIDRNDNRKRKLTLGGLLFLGKYEAIKSRVSHFHLDYFDRRGDNKRWSDRVSSGDLNYPDLNVFKYYKIVYEKLVSTIKDPFELDEHSVRKSAVDLKEAIREALVNMLIHADYLEPNIAVKVNVLKFCYLFENPGTMKISQSQFFAGGKSEPRNNTLTTYFRKMGLSERAGSGGPEILRIIRKNKFKLPKIEISLESTILTLWTAELEDSYPDLLNVEREIYLIIAKYDSISKKSIVSLSGNNDSKVRRVLEKLIDKNYIERKGLSRATKYSKKLSQLEKYEIADEKRKNILSNKK